MEGPTGGGTQLKSMKSVTGGREEASGPSPSLGGAPEGPWFPPLPMLWKTEGKSGKVIKSQSNGFWFL